MRKDMAINLGYVLANLALVAFLLSPRSMALEKPGGDLIIQVEQSSATSAYGEKQESMAPLPINPLGVTDCREGIQVGASSVKKEQPAQVYRRLPTQDKVIALTFDDGPKESLRKLLDILQEKDVPATFFILGSSALNQPELVRKILDAGCAIANHSWSHPNFTTISEEKLFWQLEATAVAFTAMGVECQPYVRPPYGEMDERVLRISGGLGYDVVLWDVDTRDWEYKDPAIVLHRAMAGIQPGSIVLFHDGPKVTLKVLPDFIDGARNMGYEFVLISAYLDNWPGQKKIAGKAGQMMESGE